MSVETSDFWDTFTPVFIARAIESGISPVFHPKVYRVLLNRARQRVANAAQYADEPDELRAVALTVFGEVKGAK